MARQGWYRLPRSQEPFYGPVPPGATVISGPEPTAGDIVPPSQVEVVAVPVAADQAVDAIDGGPEVDPVPLGDEETPEADQVVTGPPEGDVAVDETDGEAEVVGDAPKATSRRRSKPTEGE